ncbi:Autophagy protein 16 [Tolypocladium ophioglossoides CBS 100239]|uniref:Autophagy protein 16 n=1 Tax=Tolypocladium ophioglossoides (strain CBS 100239) TaxID=1163406 RepID=A0A0L0N4X0_TOLOC|nr:Autophagy protein 16 [Tolypocladium ophioglossoides CBS 100239]
MPNWREEYVSSLKDVELKNPVNMELVQACSQMADRISALEAEKAALESHVSSASTVSNSKARPSGPASDDPAAAQLRVDLAESLRSKGVTEARLRAAEDELARLRTKAKEDGRAIRDLASDRTALTTRLKDREHELREKRKLLEACQFQLAHLQVQDEMITLNLQVAVAEKERDKVKKENKELVDRWMKRMGQEAEAMNLANEPLLDKGR